MLFYIPIQSLLSLAISVFEIKNALFPPTVLCHVPI